MRRDGGGGGDGGHGGSRQHSPRPPLSSLVAWLPSGAHATWDGTDQAGRVWFHATCMARVVVDGLLRAINMALPFSSGAPSPASERLSCIGPATFQPLQLSTLLLLSPRVSRSPTQYRTCPLLSPLPPPPSPLSTLTCPSLGATMEATLAEAFCPSSSESVKLPAQRPCRQFFKWLPFRLERWNNRGRARKTQGQGMVTVAHPRYQQLSTNGSCFLADIGSVQSVEYMYKEERNEREEGKRAAAHIHGVQMRPAWKMKNCSSRREQQGPVPCAGLRS